MKISAWVLFTLSALSLSSAAFAQTRGTSATNIEVHGQMPFVRVVISGAAAEDACGFFGIALTQSQQVVDNLDKMTCFRSANGQTNFGFLVDPSLSLHRLTQFGIESDSPMISSTSQVWMIEKNNLPYLNFQLEGATATQLCMYFGIESTRIAAGKEMAWGMLTCGMSNSRVPYAGLRFDLQTELQDFRR